MCLIKKRMDRNRSREMNKSIIQKLKSKMKIKNEKLKSKIKIENVICFLSCVLLLWFAWSILDVNMHNLSTFNYSKFNLIIILQKFINS